MKGLPASGKTTWSREYIKGHPDTKRVNKDDLRQMLDNGKWSNANEKAVIKIRDSIIIETLKEGKNVIVDDTNLHDKHIARIREIAKECNSGIEINNTFQDISVGDCIKRDLQRQNSVGKDVIMSMYNQFLLDKTGLKQDRSLPKAVVFDCDGTLTTGPKDRSPYEWSKVGQDDLCQEVFNTYKLYKEAGYKIIIFTGRDAECENETKEWLKKHGIEYDHFDIRPLGNTENDGIIKERMIEKILDKYYIEVIFDDRNRVVDNWRRLGFKVYQVNEGNF